MVLKSQHYPPVNCGVEDKVGSCFLRNDCVDPYPQKDAICEKKKTLFKGLSHAICYLFKNLKHFSHQLNSKNNDPVLLSKGAFNLSELTGQTFPS